MLDINESVLRQEDFDSSCLATSTFLVGDPVDKFRASRGDVEPYTETTLLSAYKSHQILRIFRSLSL